MKLTHQSKMTCGIKIIVSHEGLCAPIGRKVVVERIRKAVSSVFSEEEVDPRTSIVLVDFAYKDNSAAITSRLKALLESLDMEDLEEIIEKYGS